MVAYVGIVAVYDVHLAEAYSWTALHAALVPPAVSEGGVEVSLATCIAVAGAPRIAIAVVVGAARAASHRWYEVAETTPGDEDMV